MSLITLTQPRNLGNTVTKPETFNPQSLPNTWTRLRTPLPAIILQGVLVFFLCSRTLEKIPPRILLHRSTPAPPTRQPSMSNRTTQWHHLNTSKLSNKTLNMTTRRKTPSRKPTSKLTRAIPKGAALNSTKQQQNQKDTQTVPTVHSRTLQRPTHEAWK